MQQDKFVEIEPPKPAPTCDLSDDEIAALEFEYRDWSAENSFCVSGPLTGTAGAEAKEPRGTPRTKREALIWAMKTFGKRLIHPVNHPNRWCFRVRKIPVPALEKK